MEKTLGLAMSSNQIGIGQTSESGDQKLSLHSRDISPPNSIDMSEISQILDKID